MSYKKFKTQPDGSIYVKVWHEGSNLSQIFPNSDQYDAKLIKQGEDGDIYKLTNFDKSEMEHLLWRSDSHIEIIDDVSNVIKNKLEESSMQSFKTILENIQKEYNFRIKTIVDVADKMDTIERVLQRYDVVEIGRIKKTIIQDTPLDFAGMVAHEVYIFDVITKMPISAYALTIDLAANLNISENFIVVRSDNDPMELETNRMNAIKELDREHEGLEEVPLLSTDPEYPEESLPGDLFYGDEYNNKFKKFLSQQERVRKENEVVKTDSGLFKWLEDSDAYHEPGEDYNKDIDGAPKVYPHWEQSGEPNDERGLDKMVSAKGNLDDDAKLYSKRYKKPTGVETKSTEKSDSIR